MDSAQAARTISNLERLVDRDEALIRDWDETRAPRRLLPDGAYDETTRLSKAYLKTDPRYAAVVAVRSDFVARGQSGFGLVYMFDDREPQQDRISTMPSYIFKCIKPDFSILERVGYTVVCWRLVDASPDAEIKWMDQYGRCM
ncbi:hypothetical protein BFJ70_g4661 [Fusarium oxysporum]|uniref:Uncharacterized protein n=1 Tax=Fusarium oxysporum f. sp. cepae TaxID=396571 RepID=A0A3L6MX20_FUSOX|nr:hypothetical protein BFJ65_g15978 [Fusarium oxysporum f. sp. cepae]RKK50592.1 hypothetical protein BFJ67_g6379 [Fusarium oxysporum f. sp. cepae]RKL42964.1 hypothetical protein BFJ70_g4661 [Fusarium oxysporum]